MNKWLKYLSKLRKKEQLQVLEKIGLIMHSQTDNLDVKKLSGHKNLYRVRAGRHRIIFKKHKNENEIIKIDNKSDNTYNL